MKSSPSDKRTLSSRLFSTEALKLFNLNGVSRIEHVGCDYVVRIDADNQVLRSHRTKRAITVDCICPA
jgi:hypothetical protein